MRSDACCSSRPGAWAPYVFVHEFGHHFAGLADECYTSDVPYLPAAHNTPPSIIGGRSRARAKTTRATAAKTNPKAAISLNNGMLVVSQAPSVLREIDRLLSLLGQYQ